MLAASGVVETLTVLLLEALLSVVALLSVDGVVSVGLAAAGASVVLATICCGRLLLVLLL